MSTPSTLDFNAPTAASAAASQTAAAEPALLLCVPSLTAEALRSMMEAIAAAFPYETVSVASPDQSNESIVGSVHLIPYSGVRAQPGWALSAADYLSAAHLAVERKANTTLLLGAEAASLTPDILRALAGGVRRSGADLAVPRPHVGPTDGLVTSALLYPLTRALFGIDIHFPLPSDAAFSERMAKRLYAIAQRQVAASSDAILWPIPEAAIAAFSVREVDMEDRPLAAPPEGDFNSLFTRVAGSLFADIEEKATFWQRARGLTANRPATPPTPPPPAPVSDEVQSLVEGFHLAYANLQEIWSLVLPPQSLLALKRLAMAPADAFTIAPNLWARIVYDFALASHLRTINRGHLLGALTPLYLAWVASRLRASELDPAGAAHLTGVGAAAFESEKPYLVSRWRWPDRFNP